MVTVSDLQHTNYYTSKYNTPLMAATLLVIVAEPEIKSK